MQFYQASEGEQKEMTEQEVTPFCVGVSNILAHRDFNNAGNGCFAYIGKLGGRISAAEIRQNLIGSLTTETHSTHHGAHHGAQQSDQEFMFFHLSCPRSYRC